PTPNTTAHRIPYKPSLSAIIRARGVAPTRGTGLELRRVDGAATVAPLAEVPAFAPSPPALALVRQSGAAPLPRLAGCPVAPLVVADDLRLVGPFVAPPHLLQPQPQHHVEPRAHLLGRHLRIFPPAAELLALPRSPSSPGTKSGASSAPCS